MAVPQKLTLRLPEGPLEIDPGNAPSPDALWALVAKSAAPLVLFDWDSAHLTHVNDAMERYVACPSREMRHWTGRRMMPADCGVLTDVISGQLHVEGRYLGPTVLRHGDREVIRSPVDIVVLRHGGLRYGVDLYLPPPRIGAEAPRLLIVDDDALVLSSLERLFRSVAEVVTAVDARDGIRRLAFDPSIRCVLSDVEMPGHGVALWRACRLLRPDLDGRFLFFSGGPSTEDDAPGVPFFPKLTHIGELRAAVAERLR